MASITLILKATITLSILVLFPGSSTAQLSTNFYSESCPNLLPVVKSQMIRALASEVRIGASLLRMFFHDCFVNGCDASILLDDNSTFIGEKTALPNFNSVRGYEVVDQIKSAVERTCQGVVSCADILAIAARDSVNILGGPTWNVKLGRRDATTASKAAANANLPPPFSNLEGLISRFAAFGLSAKDMVALSGAHTIGLAQCATFRDRIYNETNIDPFAARIWRANCPKATGSGDSNLQALDIQTSSLFDNSYFINLVNQRGLLHSDQQLLNNGSTDSIVKNYSRSLSTFKSDFIAAMIKMGDISPLTGNNGQIRLNCRKVN